MSLRIPFAATPSEGNIWDKRKGGRFLILAVNHKFDLVNHRFESILMLGRDSMPEALPQYDTKLPDKIAKLNENTNRV
jgi:hypothetical protein